MRRSIVSYNSHAINDGSNYEAWFPKGTLTPATGMVKEIARSFGAPEYGGKALSGKVITIEINCLGTLHSQYEQLKSWFDPLDEVRHKLIIEDTEDSDKQYYIYCVPVAVPEIDGERVTVQLYANDDSWYSETLNSSVWSVSTSGDTTSVTIGGNRYAKPILEIKPTASKTSTYTYTRYVTVYNKTDKQYTNYPIDICADAFDTAALVTAGKMQADGDDLRVYVGGVEVDRWLDGINTATTKVWINLNLSPKQESTIIHDIAATGDLDWVQIASTTVANALPSAGTFFIGTEKFSYTSKISYQLNGITRAIHGTSMAAHTAGDTFRWIEHNIKIYYGNASLSAPSVDDTKKPMFELDHSTNGSWVYETFYDSAELRSARWRKISGTAYYTSSQNSGSSDPATVLGTYSSMSGGGVWWKSPFIPGGITNWNFTNGEKYAVEIGLSKIGYVRTLTSSDSIAGGISYSISTPSVVSTWESWTDNRAVSSYGAAFNLTYSMQTENAYQMGVGDCTLTINATYSPSTEIGGEQADQYDIDAIITNNTNGYALAVSYATEVDNTITIDCEEHTITDESDGSKIYPITYTKDGRCCYLPLTGGSANELEYTEAGAAGVTVTVKWRDRNTF